MEINIKNNFKLLRINLFIFHLILLIIEKISIFQNHNVIIIKYNKCFYTCILLV